MSNEDKKKADPPTAPSRGHGSHGAPGKPATDENEPKWPGGGPKGEDEPERQRHSRSEQQRKPVE